MKPRLTKRGKVVLAVAGLLALFALVSLNVMWLQFALVILLSVAFSFPLAHINMQNVSCQQAIPGDVHRYELFTVEVLVTNEKPDFGSRDLVIRNFGQGRSPTLDLAVSYVAPSATARASGVRMIKQRGIYDGSDYEMISRFPLGLVETRMKGHLPGRLVVGPRPGRAQGANEIMESGIGYGGKASGASDEVYGDFRAIRDYRYGDHPRRISWPLTAKFQRLVVKEWDQPRPQDVTLIHFSYEPPGVILSQRSFENSLRLLQALIDYMLSHHIPFELLAGFAGWESFNGASSGLSRRALSALLASARMVKVDNIDAVGKYQRARANGQSVQVLLSNCPKKHWAGAFSGQPEVYCMDNSDVVAAKRREEVA